MYIAAFGFASTKLNLKKISNQQPTKQTNQINQSTHLLCTCWCAERQPGFFRHTSGRGFGLSVTYKVTVLLMGAEEGGKVTNRLVEREK